MTKQLTRVLWVPSSPDVLLWVLLSLTMAQAWQAWHWAGKMPFKPWPSQGNTGGLYKSEVFRKNTRASVKTIAQLPT